MIKYIFLFIFINSKIFLYSAGASSEEKGFQEENGPLIKKILKNKSKENLKEEEKSFIISLDTKKVPEQADEEFYDAVLYGSDDEKEEVITPLHSPGITPKNSSKDIKRENSLKNLKNDNDIKYMN